MAAGMLLMLWPHGCLMWLLVLVDGGGSNKLSKVLILEPLKSRIHDFGGSRVSTYFVISALYMINALMLYMNLEQEEEPRILQEAASIRAQWRRSQVREMDFRKPQAHGVLGIPGYVRFTFRTRRYVDLLGHYQYL
uniref:Uncharacterized protein n=1 Tax=Triticum aestivum TaxID=4565 RepID=A0A080YUI3_WHEAT|nr:unnamed protein product [Triticum aestivum]